MEEWIRKLLGCEGIVGMGHGERVDDANLGLGWIYYALARALRPAVSVVIGSYRGFAPAIIGKGVLDNNENGRLLFIDPSYVDAFWKDPSSVAAYFKGFGLVNVEHFCLTTQQFVKTDTYLSLPEVGLAFIDGYHSYEQVKFDFDAFWHKLAPSGMMLFHDSRRVSFSNIYGPARRYERQVPVFLEELRKRKDIQAFDIPIDAGVSIISRRSRHVSVHVPRQSFRKWLRRIKGRRLGDKSNPD
jgi:predicted O-methyltransferase YrrM